MQEGDLISVIEDLSDLPDEVQEIWNSIDEQDLFVFVDEINVESMSYKYYHALNHFRYEYQGQI